MGGWVGWMMGNRREIGDHVLNREQERVTD